MSKPRLILASQSPRRRQLLSAAGYEFEVWPPGERAEQDGHIDATPPDLVMQLARAKAADVAARLDQGLVIGCDTVAVVRGHVLGKPVDREDARAMLLALRGQDHEVLSGICLWQRPGDRIALDVASTTLHMESLSDREIDDYLDSGGWRGKAGAFGYQDRHGWLRVLSGSESNVVGLPMELLRKMFQEFNS